MISTSATVGERIRYYRNKKGLRIVDLAARAGISRDALMDYEADKTDSTLECLHKLAAILDVEPDKLYDDYYAFLAYPYGRKVLEARKKQGLTQKAFGAMLGVGKQTVAEWEAQKTLVRRAVYIELVRKGLIIIP